MERLTRLNIRSAFLGIGFAFLALAVSAVFLMVYFSERMQERAEAMRAEIRQVNDSKNLQLALLHNRRETYLWAITGDSSHAASAKTAKKLLYETLEEVSRAANVNDRPLVDEIRASIDTYFSRAEERRGEQPSIQLYRNGSVEFDEAIRSIDLFTQAGLKDSAELEHRITMSEHRLAEVAISVTICLLVLLLLGFIGLRMLLIDPLLEMRRLIIGYRQGQALPALKGYGFNEVRDVFLSFREMALRLNDQRQRQSQFLAAVSHDLRNPVSALQSASETLLDEPEMPAVERAEITGILYRQARHLNRLIEDLRASDASAEGEFKLRMEVDDLAPIIKDAAALYRRTSGSHTLMVSSPDRPLLGKFDADRIRQVLNNLISNAIKYSPSGGNVTIEAREGALDLSVRVSDEGDGIPADEREKVFMPFQRGSNLAAKVEGSGLGLATSRQIVEAHGGTLRLVSSEPGRGSVFEIKLPAWKASRHQFEGHA